MSIPLGGSAGPKIPTVKLPNVGDYVDLAIIDKEQVPEKDMVTGQPKLKDNGQPKQQLRLTGFALGGTFQATRGEDVLAAGDLANETVTVYLSGHKFGAWIDAEKDYGVVNVGDVVRIAFDRTQKAQTRGFHDAKIWTVEISPAEGAALTAKCEAAHLERKASERIPLGGGDERPPATRPPLRSVPTGAGVGADEEPF